MPSVAELLAPAVARLAAAGVAEARLEAELLLGARLGRSRTELILARREPVADDHAAGFAADLARRERREPLAFILGWQEFRGRRFAVRPGVLVPRWDTEPLVDAFLAATAESAAPRALAEIGCGSGAVAVSLALDDPRAEVWATDLARSAVEQTCYNAASHGVGARLRVLAGDLAEPLLAAGLAGRLDGLFANLPYLPSARLAELEPEVRDWEPALALDGGADGLDLYRRLAPQAAELLAAGGVVVGEADPEQLGPLTAMFQSTRAFECATTLTELAGRPRGVLLRRGR